MKIYILIRRSVNTQISISHCRKAPIEFIPEPRWPDDVIIEEEEEEEDTDDDKTVVDSSESTLDSSFEIV